MVTWPSTCPLDDQAPGRAGPLVIVGRSEAATGAPPEGNGGLPGTLGRIEDIGPERGAGGTGVVISNGPKWITVSTLPEFNHKFPIPTPGASICT